MKATHTEFAELVGFQCVPLKPGEFVFGRKVAAKETGLSERTVRTCISTLSKLGNLVITSTNKFSILTIEKWEDYQSTVQLATSKTTSKRPTGDHIQRQMHNSTEEKNTPLTPRRGECAYSASFEEFWNAYPLRKGKAAAYRAWKSVEKKHPGLKALQIIGAVKTQVKADTFRSPHDGQLYIPHPATWLNAGRWDDDVKPPGSTTDPMAGLTLAEKLERARAAQ
ncbi:hypothetical protein [Humidesulfovibrio idahonensis]